WGDRQGRLSYWDDRQGRLTARDDRQGRLSYWGDRQGRLSYWGDRQGRLAYWVSHCLRACRLHMVSSPPFLLNPLRSGPFPVLIGTIAQQVVRREGDA
ncbi:MAG TPA: hypothetical protein PLQ35_12420, partial [bacterium]|nr:hypothetical protein [bacterium]